MEQFFDPISLTNLFNPTLPLLEILLRGTIVYLVLFAMLRLLAQRGSLAGASLTDLLVIVLIVEVAQNAVADNYESITDGILLVAVVVFWSYAIDWLSFHSRTIRRLAYPRPQTLVENGEFLRENMKRQLVTEEQLRGQLRVQGVEDVHEVREASIERNGQISVIPIEGQQDVDGQSQSNVT